VLSLLLQLFTLYLSTTDPSFLGDFEIVSTARQSRLEAERQVRNPKHEIRNKFKIRISRQQIRCKRLFLLSEYWGLRVPTSQGETAMTAFLQKFALLVAGVLQGFDRVVFKGKLRRLYQPNGMNLLLGVNHMRRGQFKAYAAETTKKVMAASLVSKAKELDRFRYLNSSRTDKEQVAREIAR
jgi:hypothetical protein